MNKFNKTAWAVALSTVLMGWAIDWNATELAVDTNVDATNTILLQEGATNKLPEGVVAIVEGTNHEVIGICQRKVLKEMKANKPEVINEVILNEEVAKCIREEEQTEK